MARMYATEQLGPTQSLTPEGFLLCKDVAIGRTGSQIYAAHELPFLQDKDGLVTVVRDEAEVFRPETLASFEGKSITIGHEFVDPANWNSATNGTVQNVRRGEGQDRDLMIADLLVTNADAIKLVRVPTDDDGRPLPGERPLRELSCGYDAEYVQDGVGVARQRNIVGNHVALVERGRAGPRCSIQDGDFDMSTKTESVPLLTRLLRAMRTGDVALLKRTADEAEAEMKKAEDEEAEKEKEKTADTLANLVKTVDALSKVVSLLAKTRDGDPDPDEDDEAKKKKAADGAAEQEKGEAEAAKTGDAMRDTVSRAEILVPGFAMPTADSVKGLADVVAVQRKILAEAVKTEDGKAIIVPLLFGRTLDALNADAVSQTFRAASEMARFKNNDRGARHGVKTSDFGRAPVSIADMNKRNAEFWKNPT